jgi:3-methyladenine DNA glycosylase/8-oxoguanine DNA glycosylase
MIERGGEPYLHELRNMPYEQAKKELLQFTGIGPKVNYFFIWSSIRSFHNKFYFGRLQIAFY